MSSTTADGDDGGSTRTAPESTLSRLPIPTSRAFWVFLGIGGLLIYLAMFVFTGEVTGIVGIWGISLIVVTILAYGGFRAWLALG